jgi:hypothetical protein
MDRKIYRKAIANGCTPRMAEMLASRRGPQLATDKAFFNRVGLLGDQFDEQYVQNVVHDARREGYQPSAGDMYMPGLADFRGDPKAFVSRSTGARKKLKAYMDRLERGPGCDPMKKGIAPDIVDEMVERKAMEDPGLLQRRDVREVREEVIATHSPQ